MVPATQTCVSSLLPVKLLLLLLWVLVPSNGFPLEKASKLIFRSTNLNRWETTNAHRRMRPRSHRALFLLPEGFELHPDVAELRDKGKGPGDLKKPVRVYSVSDLKNRFREGYRVPEMDVRGDINGVRHEDSPIHPVVELIHNRQRRKSKPGHRDDGYKIGLAIEGGGMRACVAAGMVAALVHLELGDTVDVVYGSSAGSLIGAYFIAEQFPHTAPEIYYDLLATAGNEFIDSKSMLRSMGLGLLDLRWKSIRNMFKDRMGLPVLDLEFVFEGIVKRLKPFDWETFWRKQSSKTQELKIIASGLVSEQAVALSAAEGNFQTVDEMAECMKASMLLPGISGYPIRLKGSQAAGSNILKTTWPEYRGWRRHGYTLCGEPMADGLLFEPIPYRSALRDNCTHVIALRTRCDGASVIPKMSTIEKRIISRFFGKKLGLPSLVDWMHNQYHKLIYAEDVLRINAANRDYQSYEECGNHARLFGIATPAGTLEVKRLETSREKVFYSVRDGFAAAYDTLVADESLRGKGMEVARQIWPDSILAQPPAHLLLQTDIGANNEKTDYSACSENSENTQLVSRHSKRRRFFGYVRRLVGKISRPQEVDAPEKNASAVLSAEAAETAVVSSSVHGDDEHDGEEEEEEEQKKEKKQEQEKKEQKKEELELEQKKEQKKEKEEEKKEKDEDGTVAVEK